MDETQFRTHMLAELKRIGDALEKLARLTDDDGPAVAVALVGDTADHLASIDCQVIADAIRGDGD